MAIPEQKPLMGGDANANANAIKEMQEMPANCNRFKILYTGLQIRINTPQSVAEMNATLTTVYKIWEIHKSSCSKGSVTAHFRSNCS